MRVALLLYADCVGVPSSRKIEQRTHEDIAFRVLAANTHPDHSCISEFRRIHLEALGALFVQVLRMCERMGLVKLGVVALDGTKLKANASKHKAMSQERMQKEMQRLEQKVRELLAAAEQADAQEDAQYGKRRRGDTLPEELRRAQSRLERIRAAHAELVAEAQAQAQPKQEAETEEAQAEAVIEEMERIKAAQQLPLAGQQPTREEPDGPKDEPPPRGPGPLPTHRIPVDTNGTPKDTAQRNFTDPESRILKDGSGFLQGDNGQLVVCGEQQIIVAHGLSNQAPDAEYCVPMLDRAGAICERRPKAALADTGYFSDANVRRAQARGIQVYIAPARTPHGQKEPLPEPETADPSSLKDWMRRRLQSPEGDALYRRRKAIVEPVFGQIKMRGFGRLSLRGLRKARGEWSLIALSHNLLKLHKARRGRGQAPTPGRSPLLRRFLSARRPPSLSLPSTRFLASA